MCVHRNTSMDESIFHPQEVAVISFLTVMPKYRKLGIGTALVNEAHKYAQRHNLPHIKVSVLANNIGAYKWYQTTGFRNYVIDMVTPVTQTSP